jgi:hypothetical protein
MEQFYSLRTEIFYLANDPFCHKRWLLLQKLIKSITKTRKDDDIRILLSFQSEDYGKMLFSDYLCNVGIKKK